MEGGGGGGSQGPVLCVGPRKTKFPQHPETGVLLTRVILKTCGTKHDHMQIILETNQKDFKNMLSEKSMIFQIYQFQNQSIRDSSFCFLFMETV